MVGILVSFWDGLFSGAMLVLGSVFAPIKIGEDLSQFDLHVSFPTRLMNDETATNLELVLAQGIPQETSIWSTV